MTWLDIDTLDLKYHKGQVWRVSDTCFIWDVQAGDTISVPFVVSRECNDELVALDIIDVTAEKLQECKQLWIQKQYGTFYEALAATARPAVFTQLDTSRIQFVTSGRVLLARVSDFSAQALMRLVHKNPIAAFEHILHRIQTEPTAVVPVIRDTTVVPVEPKTPEVPKKPASLDDVNWDLFNNIEEVQLPFHDKLTALRNMTWYYNDWASQLAFFKLFVNYYEELKVFVQLLKEKRSVLPILKYKFVDNALIAYTGMVQQYSTLWTPPDEGVTEHPTLTVEQVAALRTHADVQALVKQGVLTSGYEGIRFRVPFFVHQGVQYYLYLTVKELRGGVPVNGRSSGYIATQRCFSSYQHATSHWHYDMDVGITTRSASTWHTEPDGQDLKLVPEQDSRRDTYLKQIVGILTDNRLQAAPNPASCILQWGVGIRGEVYPTKAPSDIVRLWYKGSYVDTPSNREDAVLDFFVLGEGKGAGWAARTGSSEATASLRARAHATVNYADPATLLKAVGVDARTTFTPTNNGLRLKWSTEVFGWTVPEGGELYQQTGWVTNFYLLAKKLLEIKGGS